MASAEGNCLENRAHRLHHPPRGIIYDQTGAVRQIVLTGNDATIKSRLNPADFKRTWTKDWFEKDLKDYPDDDYKPQHRH